MFSFEKLWQGLTIILQDFIIWLLNKIIELVALIIKTAASMLPEWDIINVGSLPDTYGIVNALNWIFPVDFAVDMIGVFILSTIAYFTIGILTRWAKISN